MSPAVVHALFDCLAWLFAFLVTIWLGRRVSFRFPVEDGNRSAYAAAVVCGAAAGAYFFGTLNAWQSLRPEIARSIEGGIAGAVMTVELFKRFNGIVGRTGEKFAAPLAIGIAVGRIGCFFAGLDDFTYGTQTALPWGHDFGDGVRRHPVQLYESAAMSAFLAWYLAAVLRGNRAVIRNGLYWAIGFYALQRFIWESLKPYGTVLGPFTVFHLLSIFLLIYAVRMIATAPRSPREFS